MVYQVEILIPQMLTDEFRTTTKKNQIHNKNVKEKSSSTFLSNFYITYFRCYPMKTL